MKHNDFVKFYTVKQILKELVTQQHEIFMRGCQNSWLYSLTNNWIFWFPALSTLSMYPQILAQMLRINKFIAILKVYCIDRKDSVAVFDFNQI